MPLPPLPHTAPIVPGFIVLHGNRSEDLAQTLIEWLGRHPLGPLEEEVILVQSSGMAEWIKMALAQQLGVCSAARVQLPGRFVWRAYREVLGAQAVPRESPLDKLPMTWRLMKVLPGLLSQPEFAPMAHYLAPGAELTSAPGSADTAPSALVGADDTRLLQLASQLADLFDQYQNYRTDWLQAWAAGRDELPPAAGLSGQALALPEDQRWQSALWRAVLGTLTPEQRSATRPDLQRKVLKQLQSGEAIAGHLPRRVVVFGMSHISGSLLALLASVASRSQVMLAVPNPCRFYWGDIMEGREFFRTERRRHARREGGKAQDGRLDVTPALQDMHLHAHPLLAAWGRQGRDFVRQLDAFDDVVSTQQAFPALRLDLFDTAPETADTPMLTRVQQRIRDLEPLSVRHDEAPLAQDDRSVVFHVAHSAVRELEVLHDQLLALLAPTGKGKGKGKGEAASPLNPRDVVVLVPDVQRMAPAIRAVFGQYPRSDKRYIPFDIADLSAKSSNPVILAVEWLLDLPTERCGSSELVDLLEVPAVARRFGIPPEKLPQLTQWMSGAGIRWGLHAAQRTQLDLAACGEQNSAWFGLQRMLLGYASGSMAGVPGEAAWAGIEPYAEVGGLDAELAGSLAHLLQALADWWQRTQSLATPEAWREHAEGLLAALFKPVDESDTQALSALGEGLDHWLRACEQAGFDQAVGLGALRQGWLDALQMPSLTQRFRAGGVTFCTLMPMRAIPFEVVCLLGMNEGDYPRRTPRSDFDLMGRPGMFRPGDRSRQHDDRQLMLEALLSARRVLYVSWTGHSVRDNSVQPPSVLVSQLRDYLAAAWGEAALQARTTSHPLQPFSRRYFEAPVVEATADPSLASAPSDKGAPWMTYAREWRGVHAGQADHSTLPPSDRGDLRLAVPDTSVPLDMAQLVQFYRNPVKAFFKERLSVVFWNPEEEPGDTEAFELDGLENFKIIQRQTRDWPVCPLPQRCAGLVAQVNTGLDALQRAGGLPMQGLGERKKQELQATLSTMAGAWAKLGQTFASVAERVAVSHSLQAPDHAPGLVLQDWIEAVLQNQAGERCWVLLDPGKIIGGTPKQPAARPEKLLRPWLQALLAAAAGHALHGHVVGQDGELHIQPMPAAQAQQTLDTLLRGWLQGQQMPLPLPLKTSLVLAKDAQSQSARELAERTYEGSGDAKSDAQNGQLPEGREMCLARVYPDFEALCAARTPDGQGLAEWASQIYGPLLAWADSHVTAHVHQATETHSA